MKLCALCLICHPRDHFSNRQWKTHKSICSTCVDDKQTRKICGVTPLKLEASVAKDDDDEDDLLKAQFPHMQPMISTAVVGPGDRTNGATNKELQDVDPMFPSCFTAATSPPPLINNQETSTTPTEDIVTLTAAATSNKQFPHSSQQAVEKGDNKNSKDTRSDNRTNGGTNKELQDADTNKVIEALLANTTHKLINEFEYIDFFENDYISSIVEHFGGDSKLVEHKLREDVDRMMAPMH